MKSERTTIVLNKPLLDQVRKVASSKGLSLSGFIAQLIQEGLRTLSTPSRGKYSFRPTVVQGTKQPAIDISNRDELYDLFDKD